MTYIKIISYDKYYNTPHKSVCPLKKNYSIEVFTYTQLKNIQLLIYKRTVYENINTNDIISIVKIYKVYYYIYVFFLLIYLYK